MKRIVLMLGMATIALPATFTKLHTFHGTDGAGAGTLVRSSTGEFYGTTVMGGTANSGTIFKIAPDGKLTTLYNFCSQSKCADGEWPQSGLVLASDGNFYGTTQTGGVAGAGQPQLFFGPGTVFRITPNGTLTTLYSFCQFSNCTDGQEPVASLIQGADGDLYGTAVSGGGTNNGGTIFKISATGALTVLYTFCSLSNCADGYDPEGQLLQTANGDLYGTTINGGAYGHGTVFKIPLGGAYTTLYSFCAKSGCPDGEGPSAGLVDASDGNFYGTT